MGIVNLVASHIYISLSAPHGPPDNTAQTVRVDTATGQVQRSSALASLPITHLENYFPTTGHIMPHFTNTLIGVGPICDAKCTFFYQARHYGILPNRRTYPKRMARKSHAKVLAL